MTHAGLTHIHKLFAFLQASSHTQSNVARQSSPLLCDHTRPANDCVIITFTIAVQRAVNHCTELVYIIHDRHPLSVIHSGYTEYTFHQKQLIKALPGGANKSPQVSITAKEQIERYNIIYCMHCAQHNNATIFSLHRYTCNYLRLRRNG